jgi:hypothetical protein
MTSIKSCKPVCISTVANINNYSCDPDHYVRLNSLDSWDTDFKKTTCDTQEGKQVCTKDVFVSDDPRLVSPAHSGQRLVLDNVPLNGKVQVWETPYIPEYPSVYNSYSDIHGGQNMYYYSKNLAVPFISELFIKPDLIVKEQYIDPMDSYKPHYCSRVSLDNKNCLNWIRDSQFHREDLMSKQLWNRNQTNYEVNIESNRTLQNK